MKNRRNGIKALLGFVVVLRLCGTTFAQPAERLITRMPWRTEPVEIVKIIVKGKPITVAKKFSEGDDWLKSLTVTLRNNSAKAIARIELELAFPRPGGGSKPETAVFVEYIIHGHDPSEMPVGEVPQLLLAGETQDVSLLEVNWVSLNRALRRAGYPEKTDHVEISVKSITFLDGSQWMGNEILYPDPSDHRKKINPNRPVDRAAPQSSNFTPLWHGASR